MMRAVILGRAAVLLAATLAPSGLSAQSPRMSLFVPVRGATHGAVTIPANALRALSPQRTHWLEGGLIGGAVVGLGLGALASAMCDSDSGGNCSTIESSAFFLGFGGGFVIGALIGGAVPKHASSATAPPNNDL